MVSSLSSPVLVLNKNWQAIHVATVMKALLMVFKFRAQVVDPVDYQLYQWDDWKKMAPLGDEFIAAISSRIRVPRVVVLSDYDKLPSSQVTFSRRNIHKRDRYTCQYCGVQPGMAELTLDHVIPRSQQGMSEWDNCVSACFKCNHSKANRTPKQAHMKLRREPKRPEWNPLYSIRGFDVKKWNWDKFISEAYWNVELKD